MTEDIKHIPNGHGLCLVQVTAPGSNDVSISGRLYNDDEFALIAGVKLIDFELHSGVDGFGDSAILAVPCLGLSHIQVLVDAPGAVIKCKTVDGPFPHYPSPEVWFDMDDITDVFGDEGDSNPKPAITQLV
jgi:hypothetical protein